MKKLYIRKWNDKIIIDKLNEIISDTNEFPTQSWLIKNGKNKLLNVINEHGCINKFRTIMGYQILRYEDSYWTEERIIDRLTIIIKREGNFPSWHELRKIDSKLTSVINKRKGINYYRNIFGYSLLKNSNRYWTSERIISEINNFIKEKGYFPSASEIPLKLKNAITSKGGFIKLQRELGYEPNYRSAYCSYITKRGRKTENIVYDILKDYCIRKNLNQPTTNKRFRNNKVIEFVCENNKKIGIDVTNTKTQDVIRRKWLDNKYHPYLDEFIVVVFSNKFTEDDYISFNKESPENVSIVSIDEFIRTLEYKLDDNTKSKVELYKSCTYGKRKKL